MAADSVSVIEGQVFDGDVPDPESRSLFAPVKTVVSNRHTRRAGRHVAYIPVGAYVVLRRAWERHNGTRYDRAIAVAERTGNHADAQRWTELKQKSVDARHRRSMDRANLVLRALRSLPYIVGGGAGALIFTGLCLAIATHHFGEIGAPFKFVSELVYWGVIAAGAAAVPCAITALCVAPVLLWHVGRRAAGTEFAPGWARTALDPDADIAIDESTISRALLGLRIPQISEYLKNGLPLQFVTGCRKEGRGTYCQVRLPVGVTADRIAARRADLAAGLYRQAKEVWPTTGTEAGILQLWCADKAGGSRGTAHPP